MTADPEVQIGEMWAYRARAKDPVTQVEILKLGAKRPSRVKIRFVDDEFEGREEWVPPNRLKVRWNRLDEWLADGRRWATVIEASAEAVDSQEAEAAVLVFDLLRMYDILDWRAPSRFAVLQVNSCTGLKKSTGLDPAGFMQHPASFTDDDGLVAPWPAPTDLAKHLASANAEMLLDEADRHDRDRAHKAVYGYYIGRRMNEDSFISPEICSATDAESAPVWEVLRE